MPRHPFTLLSGGAPAERRAGFRSPRRPGQTPNGNALASPHAQRGRSPLTLGDTSRPDDPPSRFARAAERVVQRHEQRRAKQVRQWEEVREAALARADAEASRHYIGRPRQQAAAREKRRAAALARVAEAQAAVGHDADTLAPLPPAPFHGTGFEVTHENCALGALYLPGGMIQVTVTGPVLLQARALAALWTLEEELQSNPFLSAG